MLSHLIVIVIMALFLGSCMMHDACVERLVVDFGWLSRSVQSSLLGVANHIRKHALQNAVNALSLEVHAVRRSLKEPRTLGVVVSNCRCKGMTLVLEQF